MQIYIQETQKVVCKFLVGHCQNAISKSNFEILKQFVIFLHAEID